MQMLNLIIAIRTVTNSNTVVVRKLVHQLIACLTANSSYTFGNMQKKKILPTSHRNHGHFCAKLSEILTSPSEFLSLPYITL